MLLCQVAFSDNQKVNEIPAGHSFTDYFSQVGEYLIFWSLHEEPEFLPQMFVNVCQKMLIAEKDLRKEIESLLASGRDKTATSLLPSQK